MDKRKKRRLIRAYFFPYDRPEKPPEKSEEYYKGKGYVVIGVVIILIALCLSIPAVVSGDFQGGEVCGTLIGAMIGMAVISGGLEKSSKEQTEYEESLKEYSSRLREWGLTESDMETVPSGQQIDTWLQEDLENIIEYALTQKLGLTYAELEKTRDPLVIYGPLYWTTPGIPDKELVYVKEKPSNILRFSCYRVVIVFLTRDWVATYSCNFNFLRNARLGEKTVEYLYRDIVSVSTEEVSTNYTLPDGKKLQRAKIFRLSVANGERIEVATNSPQLKDMLGGTLNLGDQDKSVRVIREMIRSKKG
jgi:hypothetical protein